VGKSVVRPRLGIALAPPEVAARLRASVGLPPRGGLLVRGVEPEGPADKAGIAEGDLLVAAGDTPLVSIDALHNALGTSETLTLTVVRGIDERTVTVTFEK
jgi:S1-C subfamily serine protease